MAVLHTKVKLYLEANSKTWEEEKNNILLQNDSDGNGDYIKTWSVSGLAQPTDEQLNALDSEANDLETLEQVHSNRRKEYPNIGDQLDYIYHNGLTKWKADMITPVKEKYPK